MVKLTGPGLGKAASGTLGGELIYSNWKGRAYLKKHARPAQPRSPGQVAMRAMMSFLAGEWSTIPAVRQATWDELAARQKISAFNAYQQENLRRWRSFLRPSQLYPPDPSGTLGSTDGYGLVGQRRAITCTFLINTLQELWGMNIHHVAAEDVPITWNDLVHIEPMHQTGWYTFKLAPFEPGTQWLCFNRFNWRGYPSTFYFWRSCVVTD